MNNIHINEILKLLPHRYPFILIDKVLDFTPDQSIKALKNITINELYFTGHFPALPVMPGVLQCEAMAQAMAILAFKTIEHKGIAITGDEVFYFAGIDKARFKQPVVPGDQLIININLTKQKGPIWKADGSISVNGEVVCNAELTAAYKGNGK